MLDHNHRMKSEDKRYIWQQSDWPHWVYDRQRLAPLLAQVHRAQGHLLGRMHDLGLDLRGGVHFLLQVDMKAAINKIDDDDFEKLPVPSKHTITITAFERSPDGGKGLARDTRVRLPWLESHSTSESVSCPRMNRTLRMSDPG